jgi:hypothetical protein
MARQNRGGTLVEFALAGIPMIFVLISIFEMARGMWMYATIAYAVREGTRFAIVKGHNCSGCGVTVSRVARQIREAGVGLDPNVLRINLIAAGHATPCTPLQDCIDHGTGTQWPPASANAIGQNIAVTATYTFRSALSMFWPGSSAIVFGPVTFTARAEEQIQF